MQDVVSDYMLWHARGAHITTVMCTATNQHFSKVELQPWTCVKTCQSSILFRRCFVGWLLTSDKVQNWAKTKSQALLRRTPGGGGGTQQSFIRVGSATRSKPLLLYIPFLIEKVPLSDIFHRKWYLFHIPTERLLLNFHLRIPLKHSFPSPFPYFCSWNPYSYIPPAWKGSLPV